MPSPGSQDGSTSTSGLATHCGELCAQGRYTEALHLASRGLSERPQDVQLWNAAGAAAMSLKLFDDAERFWQVAIARAPNYVEPVHNLGVLQYQRNQIELAANSFARAVQLRPDHALALHNLATMLLKTGQHELAAGFLQHLLTIDPGNAAAFNDLGLAQIELHRFHEAQASIDRAITLKPHFAVAFNTRGFLNLEIGRLERARSDFDKAIALNPVYGRALLNRALMSSATAGSSWITKMRAAFERRHTLSEDDAEPVCFAMGKVCEELGDYEPAFDAYAEGNARHRARHTFDDGRDETETQHLIGASRAEHYTQLSKDPSPDQARIPVFVVGMPRSGTSLVEQILDSHPDIHGAGELTTLSELLLRLPHGAPSAANWSAYCESLQALGAEYLERVWRPGIRQRYVVDKMPENYRHVGLIALMFPTARIIHLSRHPMDTCLSCFVTSFRRGHEYSYDLTSLGSHYQRYRRIMLHWQSVLPPGLIHQLRYEDLIDDPKTQIRQLLSYIGVPWDKSCLRFHDNQRVVRTASFVQVRQNLYARSIGRWRRFERQLDPLRKIVGAA